MFVQEMDNHVSEIDAWRSKAKGLEKHLESTAYSFNELKAPTSEIKFINAAEIDKINEVEKQRIELSEKLTYLQQELVENNMVVQEMDKHISEIDIWHFKAKWLEQSLE